MVFQFDIEKNGKNMEKHGIDFVRAQKLWDDPRRCELPLAFESEDRFALIAKIGDKHWTAVVTQRGEILRFISVRRSRKKEVVYYEA